MPTNPKILVLSATVTEVSPEVSMGAAGSRYTAALGECGVNNYLRHQ